MLDFNQKELITQSHCFTAEKEQRLLDMHYCEKDRPFHHLKPRLFIDGDQWCCLYGENLQDGIAGFGESPSIASYEFDSTFYRKLPSKSNVQS